MIADYLNYILIYDKLAPKASIQTILIWTLIILITSTLIFNILCMAFNINSAQIISNENSNDYKKWASANISLWKVFWSETLNTSIYAPLAEELVFRFFLLKIITIDTLQLDFWYANGIQALIFGVLHQTNNIFSQQTRAYSTLQMINAFIAGIISGISYKYSNSLLPSLFAHMINNGSIGLSEFFGYMKYRNKPA